MLRITRHQIGRWAALLIALEAVVVMAGWIFGFEPLTRIAPVGINMKFLSAFLFLLSAFGLHLISRAIQDEDALALVLLPGISLAIFLVTATLIVSRLYGTATGVEDLFLRHSDPIDYSNIISIHGWPSMSTLVNFFLFGLVSIAALFPGALRKRIIVCSGYFIGLVGLVAAAGYLFGLPLLYFELDSSVPMALNTALSFILLGFGLTQIFWAESTQ